MIIHFSFGGGGGRGQRRCRPVLVYELFYFGLFAKRGVGSRAQDVIRARHKCHMKSSKHPEWLPASPAFLNTRDLAGGRKGGGLIRVTFVSKSLYARSLAGCVRIALPRISGLLLLISLMVPRPDPRLERLGEEATSVARSCARYQLGSLAGGRRN